MMNKTMYNPAEYLFPDEDKDKAYGEEESEQEAIDDLNEIRAADALGNPDPEDDDLDATTEPSPEEKGETKKESE